MRQAFKQGRREYGDFRRDIDLRIRAARRRGIECPDTGVRYDALGAEPTPDLYITHLVRIFTEVMRVLKPHGTLAVNIGDTYAREEAKGRCTVANAGAHAKQLAGSGGVAQNACDLVACGLKPKDLCLIPERFAIAMQQAGFYVRSRVIWAKSNAGEAAAAGWVGTTMPESAVDRPTRAHEHVWLFSKNETYWWDKWAVAEEAVYPAGTRAAKGGQARANAEGVNSRPAEYAEYNGLRNQRDVWTLSPKPSRLEHYAMFPPELPMMSLPAQVPPRCCAECGQPWTHVVMRTDNVDSTHKNSRFDQGKTALRDGGDRTQEGERYTVADLGFFPACGCLTEDLSRVIHQLLKQRKNTCGRQADQIDHEISATVEERNALPEHVWRPGIVLDPFLGSGTVCQVAQQLGLRSIGIEMNPDGERIIRQRLSLPEGGTLFSDEDLGFAFNHFQ